MTGRFSEDLTAACGQRQQQCKLSQVVNMEHAARSTIELRLHRCSLHCVWRSLSWPWLSSPTTLVTVTANTAAPKPTQKASWPTHAHQRPTPQASHQFCPTPWARQNPHLETRSISATSHSSALWHFRTGTLGQLRGCRQWPVVHRGVLASRQGGHRGNESGPLCVEH